MEEVEEVTTLEELQQMEPSMGPRIRLAREHAGMSVLELAAHLGVEPASVEAWERDERQPRANRLLMMAGLLSVSLAWLLEGREDGRMAAGGLPSLEAVRAQLDSARVQFAEAMGLLESAQASLDALAASEDDPDPSELED
jgi:transcriptional regulator with XRE-family HTH domain